MSEPVNCGGHYSNGYGWTIKLKSPNDEVTTLFKNNKPTHQRCEGTASHWDERAVHDQIRAVANVFLLKVVATDAVNERRGGPRDQVVQVEWLVFISLCCRRESCIYVAKPLDMGGILFGFCLVVNWQDTLASFALRNPSRNAHSS